MSGVTGPGHEDETQEKNHSQYAFGSGRPLFIVWHINLHSIRKLVGGIRRIRGDIWRLMGTIRKLMGTVWKLTGTVRRSLGFVQSFVLVLAYIRPFISLIHYCFPFRQYGGAWKSWKYYTMKFSKRRVGGNRCLHPLFKSLSSWASLYLPSAAALLSGLPKLPGFGWFRWFTGCKESLPDPGQRT